MSIFLYRFTGNASYVLVGAGKIAAEAEQSHALRAEAQRVQAERELAAHAEAERAAMRAFAESIGTTVQFEGTEESEGRNQHKLSPPWNMSEMEPGANPALQVRPQYILPTLCVSLCLSLCVSI